MDPIVDMFNRIRNAQAVLHHTVNIPFSNLKYEIAKVLEKNSFIKKIEKRGRKEKRFIEITLKYDNGLSVISGIKRISKQGQRIYFKAKELKPIRGGYGISIISTSQGIMTNKEARKKKLGGEVICQIW